MSGTGKQGVVDKTETGVALVIVLAFIVLLTGLLVAFFSRAMAERQVSNSSANLTKAALLAEGAADQIIGDLQQEIAAGSTAAVVPSGAAVATGTVYKPNTPLAMLPAISGLPATNTPPNLLKVSGTAPFYPSSLIYQGTSVFTGTGVVRGTAISSTGTSLNGRSISLARWNTSLLLPKAIGTSDTDLTPMTSGSSVFVAPSWVLVARDGGNPQTWKNNLVTSSTNGSSVVGRYAYAIFHEGGLLDINAAGYPTVTSNTQQAFKSALAYADLRQIPGIGALDPITTSGTLSTTQQTNLINNIVGWRNPASSAASGTMGSLATAGYTITSGTPYFNAMISNTTGYLTVTGSLNVNNQSDRMFTSRQELIKFIVNGIGSGATATDRAKLQNALQYLTHFSRDLDQPSYVRLQFTDSSKKLDYDATAPKVLSASSGGNNAVGADDQVNPSFLGVRVVAGKTFTRNDHSGAVVGEPLVKKRFALNRLAWLTFQGPSQPLASGNSADIVALKAAGITQAWLEQGTVPNIQKYFGLTWSGSTWKYNIHNGASGSGPSGAILKLGDIAKLTAPHEPDFFELLKATLNVGSLGKALVPSNTSMPADFGGIGTEQPYNYNYYAESSVDIQVLQIGANILSQFQTSNYPPRIVFDDGSGQASMPRTIVGVANLPYLSCVMTGVLDVQPPSVGPRNGKNGYTGAPNSANAGDSGYQVGDASSLGASGVGAVMQTPIVWNPHHPSSSTGAIGAGPTRFRIVADSTTPDLAESGGSHQRFFSYAASMGTTVPSGPQQYSYAADSSSPNSSWYSDPSGIGNGLAQAITADNTNIEFTVNSGSAPLFCEPVMLLKPGAMIDSGTNHVTIGVGTNALMRNAQPVSSLFSNGGLPCFAAGSNYTNIQAGSPYVGLYLGAFPLAWKWAPAQAPLSAAQSGAFIARYTGVAGGSPNACYMTYRMQYSDPAGNWVTYDTKYGKTFDGVITLMVNTTSNTSGNNKSQSMPTGNGVVGGGDPGSGGYWAFSVDPRTSRFGMLWNGTAPNTGNGVNSPFSGLNGRRTFVPIPCYEYMSKSGGWLDTANEITITLRPDRTPGFYALAGWPFDGYSSTSPTGPYRSQYKIANNDGRLSGWMAWISTNDPSGGGGTYAGLHPGMLSQNNASAEVVDNKRFSDDPAGGDGNTQAPEYFCDPDGMVRRGMGAFSPVDPYWPTITSVGLPMARSFPYTYAQNSAQDNTIAPFTSPLQSTNQSQSRPFFLHRPFRNVGELGYVFSDTPWRNLDFSTAESGASALLDVFCINEASDPNARVAGKVNLNTNQTPVIKAILAEAYFDPLLISGTEATARIDAANTAGLVAKALVARTGTSGTGLGPLQNLSELVGRRTANTAITHPTTVSGKTSSISPPASSAGFYDGKMSYSGFSDGGWAVVGTSSAPKLTSPATDVYSAYMTSGAFATNSNNNGTKDTVSYIQRFREAPIRALASVGQTRVWNLLIDVVAQTGRYPKTASNLNNFIVEGEQRYWVHVAIDRYTGQVIDKQIEVVKE